MGNNKRACQCCGFLTLDPDGIHDICPVCFWEDDPVQAEDPDFSGGANELNLREAQENYLEIGAISDQFVKDVRSPLKSEYPPT